MKYKSVNMFIAKYNQLAWTRKYKFITYASWIEIIRILDLIIYGVWYPKLVDLFVVVESWSVQYAPIKYQVPFVEPPRVVDSQRAYFPTLCIYFKA